MTLQAEPSQTPPQPPQPPQPPHTEPQTSLADRVRAALEALRANDLAGVERLRPLYDPGMTFEDPIQRVEGLEAFMDVNRRLLGRARELRFFVQDVAEQRDVLFLSWAMRFAAKVGPTVEVEGASRLRTRGGKILDHRDYWDLGEMFASGVPGGRRVLRVLRKPLA